MHIISRCQATKQQCMSNYNNICPFLANLERREGSSVQTEPRIRMDEQALKVPDLVMTRGGDALVINVAICFASSSDTLEAVAR